MTSEGADGDDYVIKMSDGGSVKLQGLGDYNFTMVGGALTITTITPAIYTLPTGSIINSTGNTIISPPDTTDSPVSYHITNSGQNVIINSGAGDDSIEGSDDYGEVFVFNGFSGKDVFTNFAANDTIQIDTSYGDIQATYVKGDDYIIKVNNDVQEAFTATSKTATLVLQGAAKYADQFVWNDNILTVDGVNKIINRTSRTQVNGDYGRDYIVNTGANATINGRGGNDTIVGSALYGERFQFAADGGNDLVTNFGTNDTLQITSGSISSTTKSGNDLVVNVSGNSQRGSITLKNVGNYNFIRNDNVLTVDAVNNITNRNDGVKVTGTSDRDIIVNSGANVTVQAGGGDDTLEGSNFGEVFAFGAIEGNDIITNFGDNDTLKITSGSISGGTISGDDYIVTVESGNSSGTVTLLNAAEKKWIQTDTELKVNVETEMVNTEDGVKFNGTNNPDYIVNTGERVTIQPNGGNDTIIGSDEYGEVYAISSADGYNLIRNFGENDTLKVTAGNINTITTVGNDLVVSLKGSKYNGAVTLGGAAKYSMVRNGRTISFDPISYVSNSEDGVKVTGTNGRNMILNSGENVTIEGKAGNDTIEGAEAYGEVYAFSSADGNNVITNFGANDTLRMTAGKTLTYATVGNDVVVTLKGASYTGTVTLLDAAGMDFAKSGAALYVRGVNAIDNTTDNKKVTGTSGADYITNTGENVTIASGGGDDTITGSDEYGEMYAFSSADGDNIITNFSAGDSIRMTAGKTMTYVLDGNDVLVSLVGASYKGSVRLVDAAGLTFRQDGRVLTASNGANAIVNSEDGVEVTGTDGEDFIVNAGMNVSIRGNGGDDTLEGSEDYGETFIFNGVDGNDVITNFGSGDVLAIGAGTVQSAKASGADFVVTVKQEGYTGTVTLKDMATRIKRKGDTFVLDGDVNRIINRANDVKVSGTALNDYIVNTGNNATLSGAGGNDTLVGSNIYGELYQFASDGGNDVITNFGENDTLQITGGSIKSSVASGNDIIVNVKSNAYSGSVRLVDAAGYAFNTISDSNGQFLTVERANYIINREDDVKVTGTGGSDYISNSGANVTVQGGGGADTIEGSNLGEVFAFSSADGDNVIKNFGANDTLACTTGNIQSFERDGDNIIVTLKGSKYTGTVTLEGAAEYAFTQIDNKLFVNSVNNVVNTDDKVKITGSGYADYIVTTGENVTVQSNGGDDTIVGSDEYGELFNFSSADGNNVITNFGDGDSLKITAGKSMTYAVDDNDVVVTLKGSKYAGTVRLTDAAALTDRGYRFVKSGSVLTVANVNAEEIVNGYDSIKVVGTTGDDYIFNSGQGVSIQSNGGNDTIEGSTFAETFLFSSADDKNVITNFGLNDTLRCTAGNISTVRTVGDDAVVSLKGAKYSGAVTLLGAGAYSFKQSGRNLYVEGINNITNTSDGVKVSGTSGNDYIVSTGEHVTIAAGGGNDTITGSDAYGEFYAFSSADNDNLITNFGVNDTLRMTAGNTMSFVESGDDYIVTLKGKNYTGTVTLEGAAAIGELVKSRDGKSAMLFVNTTIIIGTDGDEVSTEPRKSSAQMPIAAEDYWFTSDEADANELDALMSEAAIDTSLGKLTVDGDELLTSLDDSARLEKTLATASELRKARK